MISAEEIELAYLFFQSDEKYRFLSQDLESYSPSDLFSHAKSSLLIFIQDNSTGPPLGLTRDIQEGLQIEGEEVVSYLFGGEYLKAVSNVFLHNFHRIEQEKDSNLWRARYAYIHQQALTHPVQELKSIILESYEKVDHSSLTLIEYSRCLLYYLQYEKAEATLQLAEKKTGITYNLTGILGIRTKFQQTKTAQLVLEVISNNSDKETEKPSVVPLDSDCPLHETPQIDLISEETISLEDQVLLLAWVNFFFKSRPLEDLQAEVISSYLDKILKKSMDWLVYSEALLYRSKNQFSSFKYKERSALQINTLVEQYIDKTPEHRIKYFFALNYPLRHWLKVELGEMYMKLGAVMSAFQEFETVQMWEEAVECLIMGNYANKAADIARQKLEEKKTPRMLCALGDITGEYSLYEEAWEISAHRCTRAQRTLGRREFDKGNFEKATEHYKKALEINPLYPNAWFTLGCTYMKLRQWTEACFAFQKLVCIDSNLAEAWNNLAACQINLNNYSEAYDALAHGIKNDRNNWKMLENLLIISTQLQKFFTAVECIQSLIKIGQNKLIDTQLFSAINQFSQGKEKKLMEVYENVVNSITVEYGVWRCYANFVSENVGGVEGCTDEKVLDLRLKACRSAVSKEITPKVAEELVGMINELAESYRKSNNDKIKHEGRMYLNSLCRRVKEVLCREIEVPLI